MNDLLPLSDEHFVYYIEAITWLLGSLTIPGFFLCSIVIGFFVWLIWSNIEFD